MKELPGVVACSQIASQIITLAVLFGGRFTLLPNMREIDASAGSTDVDMMFEMAEWLGKERPQMRKVAAKTKEGKAARILNVGELVDTLPNRYPISWARIQVCRTVR